MSNVNTSLSADEVQELKLEDFARGAAGELFQEMMGKCLENIKDPNTDDLLKLTARSILTVQYFYRQVRRNLKH